jgi:hypothetical protein
MGASVVLVLSGLPGAEAGSRATQGCRTSAAAAASSGLRTDRLSGKQLKTWEKIVAIVLAEDESGQARHPTLRRLWEAVDSSEHSIFIEMPDTKSYFAGRFEVTAVDREGRTHEGVIILNPRAIDRASTGRAAARANGFVPFKELDKTDRYAEVLGHELGHAIWHLASTERARLAGQLQGQLEEQAGVLLAAGAGSGSGPELPQRETDLERLARELEEPAETAEEAIWEELRASRRLR